MLFIIPNLVASFKKELFYPLKSDNIIVLFILWKGMVIMMSNYKSFSELKRLARVQLQGKYGTLIGALLIQELLVFFASGLPAALLPGTDALSNTLYYIVSFIIQLIAGVLQAGVSFMYLKAACGMEFGIGDIFYCFRHNTNKAIKVQFVLAVINAICMLPSDILTWKYPITSLEAYDEIIMMYSVALLCMLVYVVITLAFTPVFYMMLDFPNYTVKDIFKNSIEVMKGNKMRYFLLDLSFFPLMFVSVFTCGIALLWVIPYMNMTSTNFYLDLMSCRTKQNQANEF